MFSVIKMVEFSSPLSSDGQYDQDTADSSVKVRCLYLVVFVVVVLFFCCCFLLL